MTWKWTKDLNITPETARFLEKKGGQKLLDIGLSSNFLDMTTKTHATKAKVNKWNYIKLKKLLHGKETINKIKRQFMDWGKYLQVPSLIRVYLPKSLKNSYNSVGKKKVFKK